MIQLLESIRLFDTQLKKNNRAFSELEILTSSS